MMCTVILGDLALFISWLIIIKANSLHSNFILMINPSAGEAQLNVAGVYPVVTLLINVILRTKKCCSA